jgi:hypothetical protein
VIDPIRVYEKISNSIGRYSKELSHIIDESIGPDSLEGQTHLYESAQFEDNYKIIDLESKKLRRRIQVLPSLLGSESFDTEKANKITSRINTYTLQVRDCKKFLDDDLMKKNMARYERSIIKEYIEEYSEKIDLLRSLFSSYMKEFKKKLDIPEKV